MTLVSKSSEALRRAPAAIYVITYEDIARAGVTSVPVGLRLGTNLPVSQKAADGYFSTKNLCGLLKDKSPTLVSARIARPAAKARDLN